MQATPPAPPAAPAETAVVEETGGRFERVAMLVHRFRYAIAPISFSIGVGSFFLIQRKEGLAQWIAGLLLLVWLAGFVEVALARKLKLSPAVLRFITQQAHQEAFFFTLPFLLRTTSWDTGQGVFTGSVIVAAVCSMWDPLYFGRITTRPWLFLFFHALAVYVAMLVALPLVVHLTTEQTLAFAAAAMALLAAPRFASQFEGRGLMRGLAMVGGAAALGVLAWNIRPWVPPATLWISAGRQTVDVASKMPGEAVRVISPENLVSRGLYAYTAIHVPRGLREQVFHRWVQNGREISKIPLDIAGGREEGYRAWSRKIGFPADPVGSWQVQVVTESNQLIGLVRFRVAAGAPASSSSSSAASSTQPQAESPSESEFRVPTDRQAEFKSEPAASEKPQAAKEEEATEVEKKPAVVTEPDEPGPEIKSEPAPEPAAKPAAPEAEKPVVEPAPAAPADESAPAPVEPAAAEQQPAAETPAAPAP